MNSIPFWDNGFLLLTESYAYSSPVSVLFFERYRDIETVKNRLVADEEQIQCIVSDKTVFPEAVDFGQTQRPELWDYADNADTMSFLIQIKD
jgi:hypothetical protein